MKKGRRERTEKECREQMRKSERDKRELRRQSEEKKVLKEIMKQFSINIRKSQVYFMMKSFMLDKCDNKVVVASLVSNNLNTDVTKCGGICRAFQLLDTTVNLQQHV